MKVNSSISSWAYWDGLYKKSQNEKLSLDSFLNGHRCLVNQRLFGLIQRHFQGGRILEVGAGNSNWLPVLAASLKNDGCTGLDYSSTGCELLRQKAESMGVGIEVVCADLFTPPESLKNQFDFVFSYGVAEHFTDLSGVMSSLKQYLKPNGIAFTVIPNFMSIYGWLTRRWNIEVYNLHVVHSLESFQKGHIEASLDVLYADYLGPINFYLLSSCFSKKDRFSARYLLYIILTRLTRLVWCIEYFSKPLRLPRWLAPYIVIVSKN